MTAKRAILLLAAVAITGTILLPRTLAQEKRRDGPPDNPRRQRGEHDLDALRHQLEQGEQQMQRLERQQAERHERLEHAERRRHERREEMERVEHRQRQRREDRERPRPERPEMKCPKCTGRCQCPRRERPDRPKRERRRRRDRPPHGPAAMLELLGQLRKMCSDPASAGLIAIGALKDDIPRERGEIIEDLEDRLRETRSLPLRNAIRLSLKDLCKQAGRNERALDHMREMLAENDKALLRSPKAASPRRRRAKPEAEGDKPRRGRKEKPHEEKE